MADGFSTVAITGFELFFRPWLKRKVDLRIGPLPDPGPDVPLVFVANHSSWFDPFLLREVQRRMRPRAPIYTLMLESELASRPFFRRIGVLGIDPQDPGSVRGTFREAARRAVSEPSGSFIFFPQGRIWPSSKRPLGFRRGLDLFAKALPASALILPSAIVIEPLKRVRPTAFISIGDGVPCRSPDATSLALERHVATLIDGIHDHLNDFGEDAADAWATPASPPG